MRPTSTTAPNRFLRACAFRASYLRSGSSCSCRASRRRRSCCSRVAEILAATSGRRLGDCHWPRATRSRWYSRRRTALAARASGRSCAARRAASPTSSSCANDSALPQRLSFRSAPDDISDYQRDWRIPSKSLSIQIPQWVAVTTASTCSSPMERGAPLRGSSSSYARPRWMKHRYLLHTVGWRARDPEPPWWRHPRGRCAE